MAVNPIFLTDTIVPVPAQEKSILNPDTEFYMPKDLAVQSINFQVNSEIVYLNIMQFKKQESKNLFIEAWKKANEVNLLQLKTDSLRKIYSYASNEQKEEISAMILNAEKQSLTLNEEIPGLYEQAREIENNFWKAAPEIEIRRFKEKITNYHDSIQHELLIQNSKPEIITQNDSDIFEFMQTRQKAESKNEKPSSIVYKIQIGSYKGKAPDSAAKLIKKLSVIRQIEKNKDEKGFIVYSTGNLKSYQEAVTMQNQVKQEGVKNATIVAYQNGKKITLDEARKINKEP
jgi:hypothetical protein